MRKQEIFQEEIDILREHGFNPIGVTVMACEDTFIFETPEEATAAYELLEVEKNLVIGWFYGKEAFEEEKLVYLEQFPDADVEPIWLETSIEINVEKGYIKTIDGQKENIITEEMNLIQGGIYIFKGTTASNSNDYTKKEILEITKTTYYFRNSDSGHTYRVGKEDFDARNKVVEEIYNPLKLAIEDMTNWWAITHPIFEGINWNHKS